VKSKEKRNKRARISRLKNKMSDKGVDRFEKQDQLFEMYLN